MKYLNNLLYYTNPVELVNYCVENNTPRDIYEHPNSILWETLIKKKYNKYMKYKIQNLSYKDFYVYLYYCEQFNQLTNFDMFKKGQSLLSVLPRIYDGDHIAIIHSIANIAVTSGLSNIVMYRDYNEKNLPIFGNGYLIIQYRKTLNNKDVYIKLNELDKYPYIKNIHPYYGGINKFIS